MSVVLAGARPEERAEWSAAGLEPAAICELGQSSDAQAQAIDRVIDAAKRIAARGGHAAVVIDSLDQLMPTAIKYAELICLNGPVAVRTVKESVVKGLALPYK